MSGSWSDSEYISSYSFILASGIRSICMITPEMLLPVMWACRSRHRVQIDVQLQTPMTSWCWWLLFFYKWVNASTYIIAPMHLYIYAYTRVYLSVIFCLLILVFEGQHYLKAMWNRCHISWELVFLAPGMSSAGPSSSRRWMSFASSLNGLPFFFTVITFGYFNK